MDNQRQLYQHQHIQTDSKGDSKRWIRSEGFASLSSFIAKMRSATAPGEIHAKAVDALTTNETYFFRDFHPFEALKNTVIGDLIAQRRIARKLTIWCAACSTGQEPYSIAMLIREHFPELGEWRVEIIATDYSPTVLARAAAGRYNQIEINRGLPASYLLKYFEKVGDCWEISESIRAMVQYRALNLIKPWPVMPACDLVFMRNVMIYFDVPTKRSILAKVRNCILPHGSLFIGNAETTINIDPQWVPTVLGRAMVYRPITAVQKP
jgi:chemotaxis protein methyltransferase CheR